MVQKNKKGGYNTADGFLLSISVLDEQYDDYRKCYTNFRRKSFSKLLNVESLFDQGSRLSKRKGNGCE